MSRVLTNEQNYYDIADTIRQMKNVNTTYKPRQMASALKDIYSNEVEGTLPLSFQANGNNLLDYRIDGASGGVGDRTKNLLNNILNTQTKNGVTFTVNEDKSVTCNGKNQNEDQGLFITIGDYSATNDVILTGGVSGGNLNSYILRAYTLTDNPVIYYDEGAGVTLPAGNDYRIQIRIAGDYTCNNLTFYPMIRYANVADNLYEPYGYKVPVVVSGKDLFDELQVVDTTVSSEMSNYQIFKNNGKLLINGLTTSSQSDVEIANINSINNQALDFINNNAGNYIFTSSVPGRIMIRYKLLGSDVVRYTFDEYNSSNRVADRIVFRLQQNYQYNNEQMNIMFKLKQIQLADYEAYHEPTTTNIYLDNPILENESISLSETNVDIPTIEGTNVLTIDTTVQPSNVYVQIAKNNVIKNWEEIGYFIEPNIINNSFNYAKQIMQNWDNTLTDYTRKFAGDLNLRIMPLVDTLNGINFSNMFLDCNCLVAIAKLNLSNGVSFNSMFSNCYSLVEVPQLNISKGMSFYRMFSNCYSLTTIPQLNASSGLYFVGIFSSCYCLVNFGGLLNIGQAYETSESSNSYGYELDLSSCWQLTHDSLMNVINKLYDIATKGCNTQQLVLGSTNLAKLSAEEIAIATNKGWSVS